MKVPTVLPVPVPLSASGSMSDSWHHLYLGRGKMQHAASLIPVCHSVSMRFCLHLNLSITCFKGLSIDSPIGFVGQERAARIQDAHRFDFFVASITGCDWWGGPLMEQKRSGIRLVRSLTGREQVCKGMQDLDSTRGLFMTVCP